MALPQQVQAALDAADATLAAANAPAPDTSPAEQVDPTAPQPDPFGQSAPAPVEAQEVAPTQNIAPKPDEWEARYKSLQGIFNKTVPELQQQVKSLQSALTTAVERLNKASEVKEQAPAQQQAVDPKDIDNFGQDLVDMVSRVAGQSIGRAAQALDATVNDIKARIAQLEPVVQGTSQQVAVTAEQTFFDAVTKVVPNWEEVNTHPSFLAWLDEADPVYGVPRRAALKHARDGLNAQHAIAVFKAFLGPQQAAPKGPDPLDKQVSPSSAATVTPVQTAKQAISQADIVRFYDDVRRGNYRGQDAEIARIEQLINTAIAEGRVR